MGELNWIDKINPLLISKVLKHLNRNFIFNGNKYVEILMKLYFQSPKLSNVTNSKQMHITNTPEEKGFKL